MMNNSPSSTTRKLKSRSPIAISTAAATTTPTSTTRPSPIHKTERSRDNVPVTPPRQLNNNNNNNNNKSLKCSPSPIYTNTTSRIPTPPSSSRRKKTTTRTASSRGAFSSPRHLSKSVPQESEPPLSSSSSLSLFSSPTPTSQKTSPIGLPRSPLFSTRDATRTNCKTTTKATTATATTMGDGLVQRLYSNKSSRGTPPPSPGRSQLETINGPRNNNGDSSNNNRRSISSRRRLSKVPSVIQMNVDDDNNVNVNHWDSDGNEEETGEERIQVVLRMRPLSEASERRHKRVWKVLEDESSVVQLTPEGRPMAFPRSCQTKKGYFTYDKVFGEQSSTKQVYRAVVQNIVSSVLSGKNGTVFCYGQTASGKTFTMQGGFGNASQKVPQGGLVQMAAADIFERIRQARRGRTFLVRVSVLEIYKEELRDLLAVAAAAEQTPRSPTKNKSDFKIPIREDPQRGVFVQSKQVVCQDMSTLLQVLAEGEQGRAVAATAMNERSSRSHTIFRIHIESRDKQSNATTGTPRNNNTHYDHDDFSSLGNFSTSDQDKNSVLSSTLNLVDLAGSESVRNTGATGERQKEGAKINQSLLTLSRVISSLGSSGESKKHVNFRDSKLTRLLQPHLSGNAKMAIVCCATPSAVYCEETRSTLAFASRAKKVKTHARVNQVALKSDNSMAQRWQQQEDMEETPSMTGTGTLPPEQIEIFEQQIETAEHAAVVAEERFRQLQTFLLSSSSHAFSLSDKNQTNVSVRKRRGRSLDGFDQQQGGERRTKTCVLSPRRCLSLDRAKSERREKSDTFPAFLLQLFSDQMRTFDSQKQENIELSRSVEQKDVKLNDLEEELKSFQSLAADAIQTQETEISQLLAKLKNSEEKRQSAAEEINQDKKVINDNGKERRALLQEVDLLKRTLEKERKDRNCLMEQLHSTKADNDKLLTEQIDLKRQVETESAKRNVIIQEQESLLKDIQDANTQLGLAEQENTNLLARIHSLQVDVTANVAPPDHTSSVADESSCALKSPNEILRQSVKNESRDTAEARSLSDSQSTKLTNHERETFKQTENELRSTKLELQATRNDLQEAAEIIDELREKSITKIKFDELQATHESLQESLAQQEKEHDNLKEGVCQSLEKMNSTCAKRDYLFHQLEKLHLAKDTESLKHELEKLDDQLQKIISDIEVLVCDPSNECQCRIATKEVTTSQQSDRDGDFLQHIRDRDRLASEVLDLKARLQNADLHHCRVTEELEEVKDRLSTSQKCIVEHETERDVLRMENSNLHERIKSETLEKTNFSSKKDEIERELECERERFDSANNELKQKLQHLQEEKKELERKYNALFSDIDSLSSILHSVKAENSDLLSQNASLVATAEKARAKINSSLRMVFMDDDLGSDFSLDMNGSARQVGKEKESNMPLDQELLCFGNIHTSVLEELNRTKESFLRLESEKIEIEKERDDLCTTVDLLEEESKALISTMKTAHAEMEELRKKSILAETAYDSMKAAQSEKEGLELNLQAVKEELYNAQQSIQEVIHEKKELLEKCRTLEESLEKQSQEKQQSSFQLDQLEREGKALQTKIKMAEECVQSSKAEKDRAELLLDQRALELQRAKKEIESLSLDTERQTEKEKYMIEEVLAATSRAEKVEALNLILRAEKKDFTEKQSSLQKKMLNVEQDLATTRNERDRILTQLEEIAYEAQQSQEENGRLQAALDESIKELAQTRQEMARLQMGQVQQQSFERDHDTLLSSLIEKDSEVDKLKTKLEESKEESDASKKLLDQAASTLTALERNLESKMLEIDNLKSENTEVNKEIARLRQDSVASAAKIRELSSLHASLRKALNESESSRVAMSKEIECSHGMHKEAGVEWTSRSYLEAHCQELEDELTSLQAMLKTSTDDLAVAEKDLMESRTEQGSLVNANVYLSSQVDSLSRLLDAKEKEMEKARRKEIEFPEEERQSSVEREQSAADSSLLSSSLQCESNEDAMSWDDGVKALVMYMNGYPHAIVPGWFKDIHGNELGQWLEDRREDWNQGELTIHQVSVLDRACSFWRLTVEDDEQANEHNTHTSLETWLQALDNFQDAYGPTSHVPNWYRDPQNNNLGYWVNKQRVKYSNNTLARHCAKELEKRGIVSWHSPCRESQTRVSYS